MTTEKYGKLLGAWYRRITSVSFPHCILTSVITGSWNGTLLGSIILNRRQLWGCLTQFLKWLNSLSGFYTANPQKYPNYTLYKFQKHFCTFSKRLLPWYINTTTTKFCFFRSICNKLKIHNQRQEYKVII